MKKFLIILIVCYFLSTLSILADSKELTFSNQSNGPQNSFVRGFSKEYFKEMINAYSAYIPNIDIDIMEINKTVEERLIPCMDKISLEMGYSNILEIKEHLKGFISYAKMFPNEWKLKEQDLNDFANQMIYGFNALFMWNYGVCAFDEEKPIVAYHGIDYIDTLSKSLRASLVVTRLLSLNAHPTKLETFEKAMNNLMLGLRKGEEKLDMYTLGTEFCKAYLVFDPFPALPTPNAALNLFNQTIYFFANNILQYTNVSNYLMNDFNQGLKCLYMSAPSNITKFVNEIYLRYSNSKLGNYFNLSNDEPYRIGKEFVKIILIISHLFKDSLGCFNSTICGYPIIDYLKNATDYSQNWNFMNNFFQIGKTCTSPGFTSCQRFSVHFASIFRVLDNYIYQPNQDFSSFAFELLQLYDIITSYSNCQNCYAPKQCYL